MLEDLRYHRSGKKTHKKNEKVVELQSSSSKRGYMPFQWWRLDFKHKKIEYFPWERHIQSCFFSNTIMASPLTNFDKNARFCSLFIYLYSSLLLSGCFSFLLYLLFLGGPTPLLQELLASTSFTSWKFLPVSDLSLFFPWLPIFHFCS